MRQHEMRIGIQRRLDVAGGRHLVIEIVRNRLIDLTRGNVAAGGEGEAPAIRLHGSHSDRSSRDEPAAQNAAGSVLPLQHTQAAQYALRRRREYLEIAAPPA